jgi:asparagine synthase (glutamine-hydrolysing)
MSGVFGVVDINRKTDPLRIVQLMGTSMSHKDWYICEWYEDPKVSLAIGRIGIGIFNKRVQPIIDETEQVVLVMSGEVYADNGKPVDGDFDATEEVALASYLKYGKDFARYLNGVFVIALWDRRSKEVIITNDRFGLYPVFFTVSSGRFIFSPEMKGIFCDDSIEERLDLTALAQFVRFQHLLGTRTFFEDVELLENASVLVFNVESGSSMVEQYWSFDDIPFYPNIGFNEASEEAGRLLRQAVRRLSSDSHQPGVYLSGGMDSRTILGLIDRRPIPSITYGKGDCRDVYYARRIANTLGSDHTWVDMPDGAWVNEYLDLHLELTEGFHSWIHMHGMNTLSLARSQMDVKLIGWGGGTVMGHVDTIEPLVTEAVDDSALILRLYKKFVHDFTWPSIDEAEEYLLFEESIRNMVKGLALESFMDEFEKYLGYRNDVRGEYFYIDNHCKRLTFNMVTFYRSHIEVRFPYFDYDLFSFLYSIPSILRADQRLFRAIIKNRTPELSLIPYDHDEFLPMPDNMLRKTHALGVRLKRRINKHIWPVFIERPTLYADYEEYLRRDLRSWAEEILFDPRTADRGIFNQEFLRGLIARHCSGLEQWTIGKIAPLITLELFFRRFLD